VVSHAGFNADATQNQVTELYFKTSNGSSNVGGFYGDALAYRNVALGTQSNSPTSFRIVQVSTTSYTIYGSFSTYTSGSTYQLQYPSGTTWTNSSTLVSAPTGTFIDVTPSSSTPTNTINATDDTTTTTLYPVMVGATGSNQTAKARSTATAFAFNASTGTVSTSSFSASGTDQNITANESGTSGTWRGRILSKNSAADKASFLGVYANAPGVFAHNHALNAWADLYVNTTSGSDGGNVYIAGGANVAIGGVSASYKLDVTGSIRATTQLLSNGNLAAWNTTTPGTGVGGLHLGAASGTSNVGPAITFGARDGSSGTNAQAGIYINSDGTYGTRMYFATTDSYAAGSKVAMSISETGLVTISRSNLIITGDNSTLYGPNSTWGASLRVGGNGNADTTNASVVTTNGNLHIDAASGGSATYLNFYKGNNGVAFGNGGGAGVVAWMGPDGDLWKGSADNTGSVYWHAGNDGAGSGLDADLLDGIGAVQLFNNMGGAHGTRSAFDATTPSYDFGFRFVQGSGNGPATGGTQYYSWYIGLGSDYLATGAGSYGAMFAVDRNVATPYLSVRYNENNSFGAWRKISAGFADSAGSVDFNNLTNKASGTGTYTTSGDFRAPIFYDSNNTTYYTDPASTSNLNGLTVASTITGSISGNAATATSAPLLSSLGNYVWTSASLPNTYSLGITNSFVGPGVSEGSWQNYGSVMNMRSYSGGGGSLQLYVPYSPTYGGIGLQVRFGNYDVSTGNSWTAWKTLLASDNYTGYSTFTGIVSSGTGTSGGFQNVTFAAGRNRIWSFGNADAYGLSYFQGGPDYIGLHFGTATQAASQFWVSDSGISQTSGSSRAPIFYDSNDTGYYVDPNSTSQSALRIRGGSLFGPNPSWGAYLLVGGDSRNGYIDNGSVASVCTSDGNLHLDASSGHNTYINYFDGSNLYFGNGANGLVAQIASDGTFRSPIYYDYNNTGYYVDPASTSYLNLVRCNNWLYLDQNYGHSIVGLYSAFRYQGVFAMGDAYKLPADGTSTGNLYGIAWSHPNAGGIAGNLNTHGALITENGSFLAALSGSIRCRDDMRAPIFYDSNNTAYYTDPASTSVLNSINVDDFIRLNTNSARIIGSSSTGFRVNNNADSLTVLLVNNSGSCTAAADFRAPIFYDSNNTTYYTDPASTSNLNALTLGGRSTTNAMYYQGFTLDANTMDTNATGFTYSVNAPYTGPVVRFSTGGAYDLWLNSPYGANGYGLAFRTRNGDAGTFNSWQYPAVYGVNANGGGALYSTIYYDQNDTGYYVDPNGTSLTNDFRANIYYQRDDTNSYWDNNTFVLRGSSPTVTLRDTDHQTASLHCNSNIFYILRGAVDTTRDQWATTNGYWPLEVNLTNNDSTFGRDLYAISSMRAPIFYDSNNTGFYVDGNSESRLYRLRMGPYTGSSSTGNQVALEIVNTGGTGEGDVAAMSFHCSGNYGMHMHLRADGFFGIGGWSASSWRWYVQMSTGNMTAAGYISANSDPRLKEDLQPITSAVEKLSQLQGYRFKWKNMSPVGNPGKYDYGVLATDVEKVAPEIVQESAFESEDGDKYKTVAYSNLIPFLIEAIKEQQNDINNLKQQIINLKKL